MHTSTLRRSWKHLLWTIYEAFSSVVALTNYFRKHFVTL